VVGASALLDRYGSVVELIENDGFRVDARVYMLIEGETPSTMAKSTGLALVELPTVFQNLMPDIIVTVGDRFETMATALASSYMNIPLAHTMGGEVSGTIDESVRHAITKLAHIHFPACTGARDIILRMGENPDSVYVTGCPRMDLVAEVLHGEQELDKNLFEEGVGGVFDLREPFLLLSQHPVTTEYGDGERQINETLDACRQMDMPTIGIWPNADAGSEDIARGIRKFREHHKSSKFRFYKNLPIDTYIKLMQRTACMVGNSSSAIREGAFIGTPAVNIGTRQAGRQRGRNVIDVDYSSAEITAAIRQSLGESYESDAVYGDGHAGKRIADVLATCSTDIQKRLHY